MNDLVGPSANTAVRQKREREIVRKLTRFPPHLQFCRYRRFARLWLAGSNGPHASFEGRFTNEKER